MSIGAAKTAKAFIGTCELRIGTLTEAGLLTADHSVGYIDNVKLDVTSETADLKAGYTPTLMDSAVTSTVVGFTGTLQEASYRNLNFLLAKGVQDYDGVYGDKAGGVINTTDGSFVPLLVGDTTGIRLTGVPNQLNSLAEGDTIIIYQPSDPGRLSVCTIDGISALVESTPDYKVVSVSTNTPLVGIDGDTAAFAAGQPVRWYKPKVSAVGVDLYKPTYFSMQLVSLNRPTGRPIVMNIWKNFVVPSLALTLGSTDWSKFDMQVKSLRPYLLDYTQIDGALYKMRDRIARCPVMEVLDVSDELSV